MTIPVWSQADFNTLFSPLTRVADAFAPRAQAIPSLTVALHPGHVFNGIGLIQIGAYLVGDIASGSPTVSNLPSTAGLGAGLQVVGLGIPDGTTVSSVGSGSVTLSANATATLAGTALTFQQVTPAFMAPSGNPRIDRIVVDQRTGMLTVVAGTAAATPSAPTVPAGKIPVAQVRLEPGVTGINDAMITDERDVSRLGHGYRPVDTETGANYSYLDTDHYRLKQRSNGGAAMIDTLPGTATGVMPAGWQVTIGNADDAALLAVIVGSGASLNGSASTILYLGPSQRATIVSDGTNYVTSESPARCRLGAATSFYVATTGSDTNHGLTTGAPFATIQHAIDVIAKAIDLNGYRATVQVADGTYSAGAAVRAPFTGGGEVFVIGNVTTPANCVISAATTHCFLLRHDAVLSIGGFKLTTSTAGYALYADIGATGYIREAVVFGSIVAGYHHLLAQAGGSIYVLSNYSIDGAADIHWAAVESGRIYAKNITVTLTGIPNFRNLFAWASSMGIIWCDGDAFSGAATGVRYTSDINSVINTGGGGANYLPGSAAGSTSFGGLYF
ncbi:hypothetical protein [Ferrovibrio terrae]|uniref:hypothetical protein n=1 Tax=Ferrovibrio terrae TaxID=2594003 RepID=UPI003137F4AF